MMQQTPLLIIGAGPFGLSLAAYARHHGMDYLMVGRPMGFWKEHMPRGMYLRSACDWHLDPTGEATIERYLTTLGKAPHEVEPLSLDFYLDYTQWFQEQKQIQSDPTYVERLDYDAGAPLPYRATLVDGRQIAAEKVAIAIGFEYFKHIPEEYRRLIPEGYLAHTCDLVDFTPLRGKRCLILGGRQSAFEWAALLQEAGAAAVEVVHRHPSPAFTEANWSWVNPLVDRMAENPTWFRNLAQDQQAEVSHRLWAEGRLKVEPWLAGRVLTNRVRIWPQRQLASCRPRPDGALECTLDNGQPLEADQVILATGYKVDLTRVPFLHAGNLLPRLSLHEGFPRLDGHMQTNLPGLFITSMPAARDFGPFFGFTIAVRSSAKLIGKGLRVG